MTSRTAVRAVTLAAALCCARQVSAAPAAPAEPVTTTFAGSGVPGFADGPRLQAQFILPSALAFDAAGNLYVADAAAQRIRVVGTDGRVRTLAGTGAATDHGLWVDVGFADGPGAQARFAGPSGIAVGSNGDVYVADTYGSRIRRITHDGTVSTFATLRLPVGLAFDRRGNLFVADRERGIVRIAPDGTQTTLDIGVTATFGIGVYDSDDGPPVIIAADEHGFVRSVGGAQGTRLALVDEGGLPIGAPYQIVMLDANTFAYTSPRTQTVHVMNARASLLLGGDPRLDPFDGGGFADGPVPHSRFDGPLGIALGPDGSLFVADGANRRIRRITGFDLRAPIDAIPIGVGQGPVSISGPAQPPPASTGVPLPPARDRSGDYRVLYLGNSIAWWETDWQRSIAGVAEREIAAALPSGSRHVRLIVVRIPYVSTAALTSYLEVIADTHLIDAVVLHVNDVDVPEGAYDAWAPPTIAALRSAAGTLRASHVPLLTVASPMPIELGPSENIWAKLRENALVPHYADREDGWRRVLDASGAPSLDLWPEFFDAQRSPAHRPLYSTDDAHLTAAGRALVGHAVAEALLRLHPWQGQR